MIRNYGLSPTFVGFKSYMNTCTLLGWIYSLKTLQAYFSSFFGHSCDILFYFVVAAYLCLQLYLNFRSNLTEDNRHISQFICYLSQH